MVNFNCIMLLLNGCNARYRASLDVIDVSRTVGLPASDI